MHTLYWSPDTGAFVVQAVLEELGLPYRRIPVDRAREREHAHDEPDDHGGHHQHGAQGELTSYSNFGRRIDLLERPLREAAQGCLGRVGRPRPRRFATSSGSGHELRVLVRHAR